MVTALSADAWGDWEGKKVLSMSAVSAVSSICLPVLGRSPSLPTSSLPSLPLALSPWSPHCPSSLLRYTSLSLSGSRARFCSCSPLLSSPLSLTLAPSLLRSFAPPPPPAPTPHPSWCTPSTRSVACSLRLSVRPSAHPFTRARVCDGAGSLRPRRRFSARSRASRAFLRSAFACVQCTCVCARLCPYIRACTDAQ